MYKNNSRDNSKFKGYSPLQLSCNLTGKCHAIGYYSYTNRCKTLKLNYEKNINNPDFNFLFKFELLTRGCFRKI